VHCTVLKKKNPNDGHISRSKSGRIKLFVPIFLIYSILTIGRLFSFLRDCLLIYFCSNSEIPNTNPYFFHSHSISKALFTQNIKFCYSKPKIKLDMSKIMSGVSIHIEKRNLAVEWRIGEKPSFQIAAIANVQISSMHTVLLRLQTKLLHQSTDEAQDIKNIQQNFIFILNPVNGPLKSNLLHISF